MKKAAFILLLAMAACQAPAPESASSNAEANKQLVQRFYDEVINAHNPAILDTFCVPDMIEHQGDPEHPDGFTGTDNLRAMFEQLFTGYPDMKMTSNFMVASGDTVVAHFTMTGTNSGPMGEMPPTNKEMRVDGVDIIVFRDGKVTEHWGYMEEAKMFAQLGMGPGAAPPDSASMEGMDAGMDDADAGAE